MFARIGLDWIGLDTGLCSHTGEWFLDTPRSLVALFMLRPCEAAMSRTQRCICVSKRYKYCGNPCVSLILVTHIHTLLSYPLAKATRTARLLHSFGQRTILSNVNLFLYTCPSQTIFKPQNHIDNVWRETHYHYHTKIHVIIAGYLSTNSKVLSTSPKLLSITNNDTKTRRTGSFLSSRLLWQETLSNGVRKTTQGFCIQHSDNSNMVFCNQ